jgi:hypothetical protein
LLCGCRYGLFLLGGTWCLLQYVQQREFGAILLRSRDS